MTLKLKRTPGIYLVGFMGSGKSTVGANLAKELGWPFIDLDQEIETQQGRSISEIFTDLGEKAFRELESDVLRQRLQTVQCGMPAVIALGGGTFVQPQNWELLEDNGVTVWLDCPFELVKRRIGSAKTRPLARDVEAFARLFADRIPLYQRADYRVDASADDANLTVRQILDLPIF